MASTGAELAVTLMDWARTRDPDLKAAHIVELLNQSNEIITDAIWQEGNLPVGHRITQRTGLPAVYYRQLGQGIAPSKSQITQVDEACSILEAWSEVDIELAKLESDPGTFRLREAVAFIEAMSQQWAQTFFYGNTTQNPTQFFGLAPRYSTVNSATSANAQNCLDCGGTGSANTSMWLVTWGHQALTGIFPKGSAAGLEHHDLGEQTANITAGYAGQRLRVYQDRFVWKSGIALKDWRWVVRLCNIDVNNLVQENGAADLIKFMIKGMYRLPSIALPPSTTGNPMTSFAIPGRPIWYCNRTVREMLHIQALNKVSNQLVLDDYEGRKILTFMGIPVRNSDQILITESRLT